MTSAQQTLWEAIQAFELDDPFADFTFSDRLARENDWNTTFSLRAIQEYKNFMFLICVAEHPLTPSDQVDQVWHLHLLYTHSYWKEFCTGVLGREIHHGPTNGSEEARTNYKDWYAETKALYTQFFGQVPPADLWPPSERRFGEIHFSRVNRHRNWVIPKRIFRK
jgi:hypothetical protein